MKETQSYQPDQTTFVKQVEARTNDCQKYLNSWKPIKGLTLYEVDIENKTINPIVFDTVSVSEKGTLRKKLTLKPNHLYLECLNIRNARKKALNKYNIYIPENGTN
jgi:hypothetical protein